MKDWSDDDTESGDDDLFSPLVPRILSGNSGFDTDDYSQILIKDPSDLFVGSRDPIFA